MSQLHVISSNRVEVLYEGLKGALFTNGSFAFTKRLIIVPSAAMKEWLQFKLATDCTIAMGLEICELEHALNVLIQELDFRNSDNYIPKNVELALLFETLIQNIVNEYTDFTEKQKILWDPLLNYLKAKKSDSQSEKFQKRLTLLSGQLSQLFWQYGRHGCKMLQKWEGSAHSSCWQEELWKIAKRQHPTLCLSYQRFSSLVEQPLNSITPIHVHLFALSFIPKEALDFLVEAAKTLPVYYYLLSPCQLFWSDFCTNKERTALQRYWEARNVSTVQLQTLDDFLRSHNTLLANFGRMGREMALQIEESTSHIESFYRISESVKQSQLYEALSSSEISFEKDERTLDLLTCMQADMLLLRTIDETPPINLNANDSSIQLHCSYTKYREIESLYSTLVHLIKTHAEDSVPIVPSDIVVMIPKLADYEPMIRSVFDAQESLLDFQILETRLLSKNSLVCGFLHLLSLPAQRWEANLILELLCYEEFLLKQGFSPNDIQQIRTWTVESGAEWGQNLQHKNDLLARDHGTRQFRDDNAAGSWDHSFRRLLMALVVEPTTFSADSSWSLPIDGIEISQTDLLAQWISLIQRLKNDLKPLADGLADGNFMTLNEWSSYFLYLKDSYFQIDLKNKDAVSANEALEWHIRSFATSKLFSQLQTFSFTTIHHHLNELIQKELSSYRESHINSVRFCSLLPMRTLPAKVVALIGMEEGSYPRQEIPFSLNELMKNPEAHYAPSQTDFDRYLFLEALLSARKYLILSYVGYSFEEKRQISPSLLIQELFSYLDKGYLIGEQTPSKKCIYHHAFDAFDKRYFEELASFPSYIPEHRKRAVAFYHQAKIPSAQFIQHVPFKHVSTDAPQTVTIKELTRFASNPLKAYFNKTLGVYLSSSESNEVSNEEPFSLSGLEKYQLRMQTLKTPFEKVVEMAHRSGDLPRGFFKEISTKDLSKDVQKMFECFSDNGIEPEKMFSMTFSESCEMADCQDGNWVLPPLRIVLQNQVEVQITGTLKDISTEGLIYHQKRDFTGLVKVWPLFLILSRAIEAYQLPIKPQLISTKHSKPIIIKPSGSALQNYLHYYYLGLHTPSLLIPEWASGILKGEYAEFCSLIQSSFNNPFSPFYNEYALWAFRNFQEDSAFEVNFSSWKNLSKDLYYDLECADF